MRIILYHSFLCPRCRLARRYLGDIAKRTPELTVEEVEVTRFPGKAWKDGIRMIPALRAGDATISGVFLTRGQIEEFIDENFPRD